MFGKRRRVKHAISENDSCAVLVRRRMVNTYCRACPRQAAEKHHFLTPDTPVLDQMELPSRLLQDSSSTGWTSSHLASRPPSGGGTTPCNLDPVSMEMTCSTDQNVHLHRTNDEGSGLSTIDEKLKFLKQTLVCELDKMSVHPAERGVTITPSQGHVLTTGTHHYSHPHTLTNSTTHNQHKPSPLVLDSHLDPLNSTHKQDQLHTSEKPTNSVEFGSHGTQDKTTGEETRRVALNIPQDKCGGDRGNDDKREKSAPQNDSGSTEPDSVQLVSYSLEEIEKEIPPSDCNVIMTVEGGCGRNLEGEPRGEGNSQGKNEDGGSSSESDMEVPRGAVDFSQLTDNRAVSPLIVSPGLPETGNEVSFTIDLNGLCGLSRDISGNRKHQERGDKRKSVRTTTRLFQMTDEGEMKSRRSVIGSNEVYNDGGSPMTVAAEGVRKSAKKSSTIKRKRRRKRSSCSSSPALVCSPTSATSGSAGRLLNSKVLGSVEGMSHSLEDHFNHLQITPILPPSPSHALTKSQAPITSTPTQLRAPHESTPTTLPDVHHPRILPSSLPTHHHTEHPLTCTPILPVTSPNPPHNMAAILEQEMEGEKVKGHSVKASSALHRAGLSESSGVGSTMERLLDFDVICYQASTRLDFSSPQLTPQITTAASHSKSKTLMSRIWQKRRAKKSNTRQGKTPTQQKENYATNSVPHSRPKCTTSGPTRATSRPKKAPRNHTRPNFTTSKDGNQNTSVKTSRVVCGKTVTNTDQPPTTGNQTKPKTTKHRPNITTPSRQHRKYKWHLKTRQTKDHITGQKSSFNTKNRNAMTIKRRKRHYIIPPALRQTKKQDKRTVIQKSSKLDDLNVSPSKTRECILVRHQPAGQSTFPMTSSHITAYSLDNSNVPEDLLTRYLKVPQ